MRHLADRLTLAQRFLAGSFVVLLLGMAGIGIWIARQIEAGVIHRTAATTTLYVDSLIAPSLQGLTTSAPLPSEDARRLDWLLRETPLGREIAVFRVWDRDGRIVYSTDPALVSQQFPVEGHLAQALAGRVTANIGALEGERDPSTGIATDNLLEIYSPVRNRGTDEVIAVAEFYYTIDDLRGQIAATQRQSWLVVAAATIVIYLLLAIFVRRASDTITRQQRALADQVGRLTDLLAQNEELHGRVRGAAARTTALNERFLRRLSAELHDGPAQEISLALLRLDHVAARCATDGDDPALRAETEQDIELIQSSLQRALKEVRATSSGLLLPELDKLTLGETIVHVTRGHRRRTGALATVAMRRVPEQAPLPTKIALYRIVQEALANGWRHAAGSNQTVNVEGVNGHLRVDVSDDGPGFDPATVGASAQHLGLIGMRERVESLGGEFAIRSALGTGTTVTASLPLSPEGEHHG